MSFKISVITVSYNSVDTIERTIKSVINQDDDDLEYIIIDGGSTDGTVDIIKNYQNRIAYWVSEPDGGIYDAMNKGIQVSTGEWICFINADDWYEKKALFIFRQYIMRYPEEYLLYGKVNLITDNGRNGYIGTEKPCNYKKIYLGNMYCHQGLCIKRELFDLIGLYDCTYKYLADYIWLLDAHKKGYYPFFINEELSNFTAGGYSSSDRASDEYLRILCLNREFIKRDLAMVGEIQEVNERIGVELFKESNLHFVKEIMNLFKKYYIWGAGIWGEKMNFAISQLGIENKGFIDSNQGGKEFCDKRVYFPESLCKLLKEDDTGLLIATMRYEEEIRERLQELQIADNKYICMNQIIDNVTIMIQSTR